MIARQLRMCTPAESCFSTDAALPPLTSSAWAALIVTVVSLGCTLPALGVRVLDAEGRSENVGPWGDWSAPPGSGPAAARTFLEVERSSSAPREFRVRFLGDAFVGVDDANWSVPIGGNVQFASWLAAQGPAPCADPERAWGATDSDGSEEFAFAPGSDAVCVAYRILHTPIPLEAQPYRAQFEVAPATAVS